jgi:NTP pyrophosphatase (non-canonical NTP hydrolase)
MKMSPQGKRIDEHIMESMQEVQSFMKHYLENEKDQTALFRLCIVNYELGELMRMLVYRKVAPKSARCGTKEDLRTCIGDSIVNLILLAEILNTDSGESVYEAVERLENKEWRKH